MTGKSNPQEPKDVQGPHGPPELEHEGSFKTISLRGGDSEGVKKRTEKRGVSE